MQRSAFWVKKLVGPTYNSRVVLGRYATRIRPDFPRDSRYKRVDEKDVQFFKETLDQNGVITDKSDIEKYNVDWMGKFEGQAPLVLAPKTTEEVSRILQYCNENKIAVVPQGGNTGLVGGSVPVFDEIVLSLSRMNSVTTFDDVAAVVTCQSGVILEELDRYLQDRGYIVPLDLAAKGSCQIGGNVATAAGGIRFLRYGSLHANVLGLEVVLADGRVIDNTHTALRKDNTGYHLHKLFVGSEGTLGVITKVALQVPILPKSVNVCFFALRDFERVQRLLVMAKQQLGEILSAFEFVDDGSIEVVLRQLPGARLPFAERAPFYVLVETHGSHKEHDEQKIAEFLESAVADDVVVDGTVAFDKQKMAALWALRESVSESLIKSGFVYKYDFSLPVRHYYAIVEEMQRELAGTDAKVVGFGHLGDGNVHLNVYSPTYDPQILAKIEPFVYSWTQAHNGSISAEHGIGLVKRSALHYSQRAENIAAMKQLKTLFDPNRILNPYKLFTD